MKTVQRHGGAESGVKAHVGPWSPEEARGPQTVEAHSPGVP